MTAVVAFTFGSLGDILSLLQIANAVRTALCDAKASSAEYRDLLAELDSLVYTVASVQRTLFIQGPDRLPHSVENGLNHAVHVCLRLLAQANERIAALQSSTTGNLWRRVGWMLVRKDEAVVLRLRLSDQIKAIDTLLTLAQGDRLDRIAGQVDRTGDRLGSVQAAVREQHALVVEIHRCVKNLPQRLGYFWEGDPDADSLPVKLKITDKHAITIPWELCATEQLLLDFERFYYRKLREVKAVRCFLRTSTNSEDAGGDVERVSKAHEDVDDWIDERFDIKPGTTVHFTVLGLESRTRRRPFTNLYEGWTNIETSTKDRLLEGNSYLEIVKYERVRLYLYQHFW